MCRHLSAHFDGAGLKIVVLSMYNPKAKQQLSYEHTNTQRIAFSKHLDLLGRQLYSNVVRYFVVLRCILMPGPQC